MFCNQFLYDRHFIFCLLQFLGSTAGTISLCMSSYGLASSLESREHYIQNTIIVSCILTTIITNAIKDSLLTNTKLLRSEPRTEQNIDV